MDDQAGGQPNAPSGAVQDNAFSVPWTVRDVWIGAGVVVAPVVKEIFLMHLSTNALGLGAAYLAARMGIGS